MPDPALIDPDVLGIQRIDAVPRILAAVARITGMRFTAVARVTDTRWMACAVHDGLGFGLPAGGELELESTICNEIRQHHQPVVFGHASQHDVYATHHTPLRYGLESYMSVPIFRRDGEFFGTLCAIDSRPADLDDPVIVDTLQLFAEVIGMQLELADDLDATRLRLRDAEFREQVLAATEREIRDMLLPVVTNLYLLRTLPGIPVDAGELVADTEASCERLTRLLRDKLDIALGRIEQDTLA